ncbi:phage tail length tape measure family protein [Enterobacter hormaechei]|uniref:phage tail length tape measure family protein n=1 Tax=Enterobacter hormaechei TaxID=158836 RepID=UPI0012B75701|nr:phage tail length tape measure family protein [Enterobacter hormaechei]
MAEQTSRLAIIIDSTGAERSADSLASSLGKMTQAGEQASNSANKVKKATKEEADALSDLLDRIDPVNAALNKLDKQQRELSKFKAKNMIDDETFDSYSKQIEVTRNRLTGFSDQLNKTGMSAKQTAAAMRMVPAQMTDIVVSLASGQAPLTVLLQQGGQLKDMFGGIGPAAKALGSYVVGLINPFTLAAAAVGALGLAYYKGSQEQDEFNKSLTLTGNTVGKTAAQLSDIAASVSSTSKATTGASAAVLNQLVSSGKVAADSLEQVTRAVVTTSHATGIATEKLVDDFNKIAADPISAISDLNDKYHFLTVATYNQIKALQDEGNTQEAARVATDAYANTMQQRSADIQENLGLLEKSWKSLSGAAKDAWDTMLNIGREQTVVDKLATLNENIADAQKRQAEGGVWNRFVANSNAYNLEDMIKKRDALQAQITTEDVLSDAITKHNQAEQERIKIQQDADRSGQQYLTNSDRRAKAIQQETKFLEAGAITAEEYAKRLSRINEMYKDPEPPKGRKEKAYTEDAATRLLDQINQQTAAMQSQLDASDKLNSATQARVKFEQQIADLKSKTQLTADQQSILARSQEILQAYKNQEALQNSVKTLDDYQKMQEQVKSKDEQTNDLLRERIALLEKARATGKLKPGEYEQTRSNIYKNTPVELPSTVKSVIGNLTPTGGELSGTFNGLQNQYGQLDQAQQQLQAWLQAQEDAYAKAGQITADGEARMTAIRQQAAQANQTIEWQKYEIITSATQSFMDSGLQILSDGFGQQSAIYKAAFAASKAYAIAQSMVAINAGIAQAANGPFPANIIAMASVAAQTASIVSNIKAVADTGFMSGGYTGNGATRSISGVVHGQEYVFDAAATKRIGVSNLEAIRNGGLDATLSKPGFGTGNKNASSSGSSSQTNHISQVINMPQSPGMTQQEMDAVLKLNNKQLVNELSNQTLEGKGQFGKSLRAAQGRGNRMT